MKKSTWGYKIFFGYLTFVAGILFLVFKASSEKVDLVSKDYYEQELVYQQRINANANTRSLSAGIKVVAEEKQISVSLPKEFSGKLVHASLYLYCPSDQSKDFSITKETSSAIFSIARPQHKNVLYLLKISFDAEGRHYYSEHKLNL